MDIFIENPIAIKWIIPPIITAWRRSSKMIQNKTNAERDGMITKIEMIEPFKIISFIVNLSAFVSSDNNPDVS